jgi:hypothetical protein
MNRHYENMNSNSSGLAQCVDNLRQAIILIIGNDEISAETKGFLSQLVHLMVEKIEEDANGGLPVRYANLNNGYTEAGLGEDSGEFKARPLWFSQKFKVDAAGRDYLVDLDQWEGAQIRSLLTGRRTLISWDDLVGLARDQGIDEA